VSSGSAGSGETVSGSIAARASRRMISSKLFPAEACSGCPRPACPDKPDSLRRQWLRTHTASKMIPTTPMIQVAGRFGLFGDPLIQDAIPQAQDISPLLRLVDVKRRVQAQDLGHRQSPLRGDSQ